MPQNAARVIAVRAHAVHNIATGQQENELAPVNQSIDAFDRKGSALLLEEPPRSCICRDRTESKRRDKVRARSPGRAARRSADISCWIVHAPAGGPLRLRALNRQVSNKTTLDLRMITTRGQAPRSARSHSHRRPDVRKSRSLASLQHGYRSSGSRREVLRCAKKRRKKMGMRHSSADRAQAAGARAAIGAVILAFQAAAPATPK